MKINELYKINELEEKCSILAGYSNDEFYDMFFIKQIEWLLDNEDKINADFSKLLEKNNNSVSFQILLNTNYIDRMESLEKMIKTNNFDLFLNCTCMFGTKTKDEETLNEKKAQFKYLKSLETYDAYIYFERIKRR